MSRWPRGSSVCACVDAPEAGGAPPRVGVVCTPASWRGPLGGADRSAERIRSPGGRGRAGLGWIFVLFFGLLVCSDVAGAGEAVVVDLLPPGVDRAREASRLSRRLKHPIVLESPGDELVETLQWAAPAPAEPFCAGAGARALEQMAQGRWTAPPDDVGGLCPALLRQAEEQVLFLDLEGAIATLEMAREMAPCLDEVLEKARIRDLFLLEGVAHVYLEDGSAREWFIAALGVDPDTQLGPDYSEEAQAALAEAKRWMEEREAVPLRALGSGGRYVLDGTPLDAVGAVLPGRHLLQAESLFGEVRSCWIEVEPIGSVSRGGDGGGGTRAWEGCLGLIPASEALETLTRDLSRGRLDGAMARRLDLHAHATGHEVLLFAVADDGAVDGGVRVVAYRAGRGVVSLSPEVWSAAGMREGDGGRSVAAEGGVAGFSAHSATRATSAGAGVLLDAHVAGWRILGDPAMYAANGEAVGVGLGAEVPGGRVRVAVEARWLPPVSVGTGTGCDPPDAGQATVEQVACAAGLLPRKASWWLAADAGYRILSRSRFSMTPFVGIGAARLPNTLVYLPDQAPDLGGYLVADAWMFGPSARVRADYLLHEGRLQVLATCQVFGGMTAGRAGGTILLGFPVGLLLGVAAGL